MITQNVAKGKNHLQRHNMGPSKIYMEKGKDGKIGGERGEE